MLFNYLDFKIFGYDYPVFNLADILIVLGIIGLLIKSFKEVTKRPDKPKKEEHKEFQFNFE